MINGGLGASWTAMLTERLVRRVCRDFPSSEADGVLARLDRLSAGLAGSGQDHERLLAAVVLVADGRLDRLDVAVDLVQEDWRDLLTVAGLGNGDWRRRLADALAEPASGRW